MSNSGIPRVLPTWGVRGELEGWLCGRGGEKMGELPMARYPLSPSPEPRATTVSNVPIVM